MPGVAFRHPSPALSLRPESSVAPVPVAGSAPPEPGAPVGRRRPSVARRGAEHAAVLAAYLVLTIAMTYPVARHAAHAIPIDHQITDWYPGDGDPWHYLWAFWYFKRALSAFPPHLFWTDLVFYPIGFEIPFITGIGAILVPAGL